MSETTVTPRRISARIGGSAESATLAVDAKAKALKAAGRPVIGFGAGEPDFPTPAYVVEAAVAAARDPPNHRYNPPGGLPVPQEAIAAKTPPAPGDQVTPPPAYVVEAAVAAAGDPVNHRYTPAGGLPVLKEAIVAKTARDSGYEVTPAQVLVTNGGKQAVYEAFATLLDPGDEVLLPAPYWTTYPEAVRLAGGVPVEVLADETQDYLVTVDQLEAATTERTKVLLFCSPSNPTGAVYPAAQVEAIGRWAQRNDL